MRKRSPRTVTPRVASSSANSCISGDTGWSGCLLIRKQTDDESEKRQLALVSEQESFSEATGIPRRTLRRIERGDTGPRYSDLLRIAAALKKGMTALMETSTS
ncbi:helix-turn-helix domain-containing protein [Streptomyces murinus]|uniref:helix-turn-helix domain-containing protein n=1 Tax=Streptomyces murinus TaxID=33900 RepID=UPI000A367895|nr:helix-turn-helix domain-containing protein [Streptomyces sp. SID6139]MYR17036.1 helix-turn-helix domain-containing protein [Streptomyces sp. SID6137]MYR19983.1 helix-turn-helix domain-containing protein [Streptomyces sp. SID6137]